MNASRRVARGWPAPRSGAARCARRPVARLARGRGRTDRSPVPRARRRRLEDQLDELVDELRDPQRVLYADNLPYAFHIVRLGPLDLL